VYLADVYNTEQLSRSQWFQWGWTLQELIAPRNIQFFSQNWTKLGDKRTLAGALARITGISKSVLNGEREIRRFPLLHRGCPGLLGAKQQYRKIWHTVF